MNDDTVGEEAIADLRLFGATEEQLAAYVTAPSIRRIEVEPENAGAVRLFHAMGSQWKVVSLQLSDGKRNRAMLVRTGLDFAALPVVAGAYGTALDPAVLDALRILESETLQVETRQRRRSL